MLLTNAPRERIGGLTKPQIRVARGRGQPKTAFGLNTTIWTLIVAMLLVAMAAMVVYVK